MDGTSIFAISAAHAQVIDGGSLAAAGDVSLFGLFLQAGFIVQLVMIGLLLASIWSWAIIFDKVVLFARTRRQLNRFEEVFWSGGSLEDL